MIKIKFIIFFLLIIFHQKSFGVENKIILKIDNEIITTIDIKNEYRYLTTLNKNFKEIEKNKALKIAKNSIIKEKIKKIELEKNINIDDINNDVLDQILKNIYNKLNIYNIDDFEKYLNNHQLELDYVQDKIKIETLWNELIYKKYNSKIKINIDQIKEEIIKGDKNKLKSYLLSEIVFTPKNKKEFESQVYIINNSIMKNGFEKTAYEYSISESANNGGKLDWIEENVLNKSILENLNKITVGKHTNPIRIPQGFIILKIEDIQKTEKDIDFNNEIQKIIKFRTNEQLNQFSKIFYEKIKKDIEINEL